MNLNLHFMKTVKEVVAHLVEDRYRVAWKLKMDSYMTPAFEHLVEPDTDVPLKFFRIVLAILRTAECGQWPCTEAIRGEIVTWSTIPTEETLFETVGRLQQSLVELGLPMRPTTL